jgi:cobaltochelatase CobN
VALLGDLAAAGYDVRNAPQTSGALFDGLAISSPSPQGGGERKGGRATSECPASLSLADYAQLLTALPAEPATRIHDAWGDPADDPDARDGRFWFRVGVYGNIAVVLPPDRGRPAERRADYHDPALPPRHALVAFWQWLRHVFQADALVHMGAHGTLEWLPGKAVALTAGCFPEVLVGALPVFYPFIVSNPGEAAQAKRRIAAVTIGHLPPPLAAADLSGDALRLERLVDEYAQADGLDRRRRERLAALIVEAAHETGLGREAGVDANADADEVLRRIDAWLCDLKDLSIKDGLHVYGRAPMAPGADPTWQLSTAAERQALLAALDGRRVPPGPAGAPMRGRRDVLPTGRNLFVADPRMLPTPTAMELGQRAAAEVIRCYLQAHGEMPRALVIDLWGSATLRTGGEEIAQGFSLMGCRPTWDPATGRVTGIEVLPPAAMGRPRVDVTWRISRPRSRSSMPPCERLRRARKPRMKIRWPPLAAPSLSRPRMRGRVGTGRRPVSLARRPALTAPASRIWSVARPIVRLSVRPIWLRRPMPTEVRKAGRSRCPMHSPNGSQARMCWCIRATIPAATCSKAQKTRRLSAASRLPQPRSAVLPI